MLEHLTRDLGQEEGEGAVGEAAAVFSVVRVEGGFIAVEVLAEAVGHPQVRLDHRDETLVRVQVSALVPGYPPQAEDEAGEEDQDHEPAELRPDKTP